MNEVQRIRPTIVCLCGSTRFREAFQRVNRQETLAGKIVLAPGCFQGDDGIDWSSEVKQQLDELHLRKIDLADVVYILNVGGYIGLSTRLEIGYARQHGKRVLWLESGACEDNEDVV
jgi:hypothetical protein